MKNVLVLISIITFSFGCTKKSEGPPVSKEATLKLIKTKYLRPDFREYWVDAWATFTINGKNITPGEVRINDTTVDKHAGDNFRINNLHVAGTYWAGYVDGNNIWTFSGGPDEGIPAFVEAAPAGFSSIHLTNTDSLLNTINRSTPFTIKWDNSVPCDSIEVVIHDRVTGTDLSSGFFRGTASSYTFTVNQLATLHPFDIFNDGPSNSSFISVYGINYRKVKKDDLKIEERNVSNFSILVNIR